MAEAISKTILFLVDLDIQVPNPAFFFEKKRNVRSLGVFGNGVRGGDEETPGMKE